MRGITFGVFLLMVFAMMFAAQTIYERHQEDNETFDIYNYTENRLIWNYSSGNENLRSSLDNMTGLDYDLIQSNRISNIITKSVDWLGYTAFEFSKWAMEYGYTHPEYNFGYFMQFVKYWLIAMIVIAIIPILIPLAALIYLLIVGIKKVVLKIRGWFKKDV